MRTVLGIRDESGRYYFGVYQTSRRKHAERIADRNGLLVVELFEECRQLSGDNGVGPDCGCGVEMTPNAEFSGAAQLHGAASAGTQGYASGDANE